MFHRCKTQEDVKILFRKLAKYLHPDTGGDHECFILLSESFENTLLTFKDETKQTNKKEFKGNPGKYQKTDYQVTLENDEDMLQIIYEIYKYAEKHKKFNTDYIDSVNGFFAEKGYVTASQYNSLVKIYYSFRMDEEEE